MNKPSRRYSNSLNFRWNIYEAVFCGWDKGSGLGARRIRKLYGWQKKKKNRPPFKSLIFLSLWYVCWGMEIVYRLPYILAPVQGKKRLRKRCWNEIFSKMVTGIRTILYSQMVVFCGDEIDGRRLGRGWSRVFNAAYNGFFVPFLQPLSS